MGLAERLRSDRELQFRIFKYSVYALLTINIYFWFMVDYRAAVVTFDEGINLGNVIDAFPATVDTFFWVLLLVLFELETAIIPDEKLKGGMKWLLLAVRSISYFFICMAMLSYWTKLSWLSQLQPLAIADPCSLIGSSLSYLFELDEYYPIDAAACAAMAGEPLFRVVSEDIIGTASAFDAAIKLALLDVINAADWLVIVFLLELEVWLQLRDRLTDSLISAFKWIKVLLYGVLFLAAVYWGLEGDFIDFWDAFLWLVAFIFIELNIFQWHEETEEEKEQEERARSVDPAT